MKEINLYTDGACSGNPGPGGWAFILEYKNVQKEMSGAEKFTTNNKMELLAVIEGLKVIKEPCIINLYSDSQYVIKSINEWLSGWIAKGWKNSSGEVKNKELWQLYVELAKQHVIKGIWVKAHNGHILNERCDTLAQQQTKN